MKKLISLVIAMACTISVAQAANLPEGRTGYGFDFSESADVNLSKFTKMDSSGNEMRSAQITDKGQGAADKVLKMTSNAGDTAVSSFVQLIGSQVSFSKEPQAEEVVRYSFEVSRENFGANDVLYIENNLVSADFKSVTTGNTNYRPINIAKITGTDGSVKFWGENGGSERAVNGIQLDENQWYKFDLLIYRDMGARLYINGIQYTTGVEDLQNGRYYTTIQNQLEGGTVNTKNINLSAVGGVLKLYMVPKDGQQQQKVYFDNVSVELMSESKAMEEVSSYALCGGNMVLKNTDMTVGEFRDKIDFPEDVKVYNDSAKTILAEEDEQLAAGMTVQIFNNSYEISELYGNFSFTRQDNGTVLASFYTNVPEDTQIFAAHYASDHTLKAVKNIEIQWSTGVRRIKTTTELSVDENDSLQIFCWNNTMHPLFIPKPYPESNAADENR